VAGFLSAYRPPSQSDTIFVWQVAVDDRFRSRGMASRMLDSLLHRDACNGVRFLEATITPSNTSSQKLFLSLAKRLNTKCRTSGGFTADLFLEVDHEPEELYRVGPFELHDDHGEDQ
jgi:L-2,4-diaminobutyric acid acetyltransferase